MLMRRFEYLNVLLLCVSTIILIGLQIKLAGFVLLALGLLSLWLCSNDYRKNVMLIYLCIALLGITPINTSTDLRHIILMGVPLFLTVFVPYWVTKRLYKNNAVRFPFHHGRQWYRSEILYVLISAGLAYLLLPFMLRDTGSYHNWEIEPGAWNLAVSYIGLNVVGIWDELFFVSTVLGILRRFLPFWVANLAQAVIFTSFLYTLGFQGWSFVPVYLFALSQGYIFKKTDSLLYVLTIHLTIDLVLHLTLVHLHNPAWLPIFIT
jgi:membrane protease YdiL (CAAX protease family)